MTKEMHLAEQPSDTPAATIDYQAFVARSADVNIVSKPDGVYLYVSPGCHQLFGWTPNDLEGKPEDDLVHPDDRMVTRTARADLSESDFVTTTHRHLCHDGSYRWIEATSRLVEIDGWALIVSSLRDITSAGTTRPTCSSRLAAIL